MLTLCRPAVTPALPSDPPAERSVRGRLPGRHREPRGPPPHLPVGRGGQDGRGSRAGGSGGVHHGRGGRRGGAGPAVHQRDGRAHGFPRARGAAALTGGHVTSGTGLMLWRSHAVISDV